MLILTELLNATIHNFGANKFLHLIELITSGTRYNDGPHKEFKSTESSNMNVWPKLDILQDKSNYQASYWYVMLPNCWYFPFNNSRQSLHPQRIS